MPISKNATVTHQQGTMANRMLPQVNYDNEHQNIMTNMYSTEHLGSEFNNFLRPQG